VIFGGIFSFCFVMLTVICPLLSVLFSNIREALRKSEAPATDNVASVSSAHANFGTEAAAAAEFSSDRAQPPAACANSEAISIELHDTSSTAAPV
jgi:hypothetical protein